MEGTPQFPDVFYCETCRLSRADPYASYIFFLSCLLFYVWNEMFPLPAPGYFLFIYFDNMLLSCW
jgi:hypothetical protein